VRAVLDRGPSSKADGAALRSAVSLLAGAVVSLGLIWNWAVLSQERQAGAARARLVPPRANAAAAPCSPPLGALETLRTAAPREAAQPVEQLGAAASHSGERPRRTRVQGGLFRAGRLAYDQDLLFVNRERPDVQDWDITDEEGRFAVELSPGCYDVLLEDDDLWLTTVLVPRGWERLTLDLEIP
jgi:hypothetical protein